MSLLRRITPMFLSTILLSHVNLPHAQTYPTRTIRIVTTDAGGSADFFLRPFALALARSLGQPVVIDNRPGSGAIPPDVVSKAAPDGYTLLFLASTQWITPLLQKTPYDPIADFAPITLATKACSVVVVTPTLPVKSVKDVIALAKAQPGELVYAHGSSGSASHLSGAMFQAMTGVKMLVVPYKGSAQALLDVMSGRAQMMFPNSAVVPPHLKSGRLRALAVTSAEPSAIFPGLPTVAATVPGFSASTMNGLWAPARTSEPVIHRLNQDAVRFILAPETRDRLAVSGVEPVGSSPQEFAKIISQDVEIWRKVIKTANIRAEE